MKKPPKATLTMRLHPRFAHDIVKIMDEVEVKIEKALKKRLTYKNSQEEIFHHGEVIKA
jgi:hypothetical protein